MSRYQESDEKTHVPSGEVDFNESMYLNYFDEDKRIGGFLRVANRPNEGVAEVTNTSYLADGSVLFSYQKPAIQGNQTFEAGGMKFEVIQPFKRLGLSYQGTVFHFLEPGILKDPKKAYTTSPQLNFQINFQVTGLGEIHDNVDRESNALKEVNYWKEHYEQVVGVEGEIQYGNMVHSLKGLGLRDHSWGPRTWQSPKYYRFLSGVFDEETAFGLMYLATAGGRLSKKGFLSTRSGTFDLKDISIETEYAGPDNYHNLIHLELITSEQVFRIEGRVMTLLPLRNRKEGRMVRIAEGMTEWNWKEKRGYGLSEYLDHI
jgi:hypothetical protein